MIRWLRQLFKRDPLAGQYKIFMVTPHKLEKFIGIVDVFDYEDLRNQAGEMVVTHLWRTGVFNDGAPVLIDYRWERV